MKEFEASGAVVLGCSIDSEHSHKRWIKDDLGDLHYPLLADVTKRISRDYGVLLEDSGIATRGTFIIDPEQKVQYAGIHNLSVGRDANEILRVLQALKSGELCGAGWKKGAAHVKSVSDRVTHDEFLARLAVEYPLAAKDAEAFGGLKELVIPTLIAPEALSLPRALWNEAQRLDSVFHNRIRENQNEAERLRALSPALQDPGHYSVLMSYDFHVDPNGALRLIEINTNASLGAMVR